MSVTTTATPLIECRMLSAGYGPLAAIRDVDLRVQAGEVVALIGRNGAGKSSTLLALSGALSPMAGEVRWMGKVTTAPLHTRCKAGLSYLTEERSIIMNMTAADNLRLGASRATTRWRCSPSSGHSSNEPPGSCRAASSRCSRWLEPSVATLVCCSPTSCPSASRRSS
jgi:ABC-type sugar transport system ATPase subunit